jgi:hypothetical protein
MSTAWALRASRETVIRQVSFMAEEVLDTIEAFGVWQSGGLHEAAVQIARVFDEHEEGPAVAVLLIS